jgi:hypothetical protein
MNEPGIVVLVVVVLLVVVFGGRMLEVEVVLRFEVLVAVMVGEWSVMVDCMKLLLLMRI